MATATAAAAAMATATTTEPMTSVFGRGGAGHADHAGHADRIVDMPQPPDRPWFTFSFIVREKKSS